MKASDLFAAGTRIIGILAIIKAIGVLIMTVPSLFGHNYPGWAMHMQIMTLVYPLAADNMDVGQDTETIIAGAITKAQELAQTF